ncbi:MAG: hypothetical protein LBE59_00295 [Nevskiaceae bacterium]|jgi:predicted nucleotidyltransferase|nr:hypothetical protein [Nevskiaceae bacterium]
MNLAALETVLKALQDADVKYLIAGGLAVNAHGYLRLTLDIDLVIALNADNILRAFDALTNIGYRPIVPITAASFANAEQRKQWREERNMQVLNFFNDSFPGVSVDVFVYEPFDFSQEYEKALKGQVLPGINAAFVSIPTLISMKQAAARSKDMDDIQHLEWIQEKMRND